MNPFIIDAEGEARVRALAESEARKAQTDLFDEHQSVGWPGDGSGLDDLADYNQNEADDYRDE